MIKVRRTAVVRSQVPPSRVDLSTAALRYVRDYVTSQIVQWLRPAPEVMVKASQTIGVAPFGLAMETGELL
jgi:beta-phosphoglucomutase-like phosphatase (HAD superfamily)